VFWNRKYNIEELKGFYRDELINSESLYLHDIWNFTDEELEEKHDYIQWLLPIDGKSHFNRKAPVLTSSDIAILKSDSIVMQNLIKGIRIFLDFLGLELTEDDNIRLSSDFESKKKNWLKPRNHNYKRISRLLIFCKLFGFTEISIKLMIVLTELYNNNKEAIGEETYRYWKAAFMRN
jgi:hypothetical protein